MSIYLIAFQMSHPERTQAFINNIKAYGIWARITDTTWCIKASDKTTAEIRDSLNERFPLRNDEKLMVVNITKSPWASYYLPKEVADWLKDDK